MGNSFQEGFYLENETGEIYYCTGKIHPKDSKAKVGVRIGKSNLFLYKDTLKRFSRLEHSKLSSILKERDSIKKIQSAQTLPKCTEDEKAQKDCQMALDYITDGNRLPRALGGP